MPKKKLVLNYPPMLIEKPVINNLIKDFGMSVTILRARVKPRQAGRMVVEIEGEKSKFDKAIDYLTEMGVRVDAMVQEMRYYPENCVHCTACTAVCPTEALSVDEASRELVFDPQKCIMCESCIAACSYGAMESNF